MKTGFIAAISGSAGADRALEQFFDQAPHDGVSYVILRHLTRNVKMRLQTVLACHSELRVVEVRDGMLITPDFVYLPLQPNLSTSIMESFL